MEVILSAGLTIGILMFLLLLVKQDKKHGDFFFLGWVLTTLLQVTFYKITIYEFDIHGLIAILSFGLPLLGAPFLFLYILSLTGHKVSIKTVMLHLCVYMIYCID